MIKFLRLSCCLATFFLVFNTSIQLEAQSFSASVQPYKSESLAKHFKTYQVFQLDAQALDAYVSSNSETKAQLKIGSHNWHLALTPNHIFSDNYSLQVSTPKGIITTNPKSTIAFKGLERNGGGRVRLTLNGEFLYGFVEEGINRYYIEPLWYFEPSASRDLFVLYLQSSVIPMSLDACGLTEEKMERQHLEDAADKGGQLSEKSGCYELDLAIASDRSMFDKYGSVSDVENHNVGVINDVQVDYYGSFDHNLEFVIVTQFVVSGSDPWTNSTDPDVLLGSFRDWGNNGGFGVNFDNGELWTNRMFSNGVAGVAYLNGICNNAKYHCLRDHTTNAEWLRCMTSHEIGHNFGSGHDSNCPPDFIMCPYVSLANTWSQQSSDAVNAYMQSKINSGCLTACGPYPPLIAGFDWMPDPTCQNQAVNFTDLSSGNITKWAWTFGGGIPPTSNLQNPTVTWNSPGAKNATLTITGQGGSNSLTQTIDIQPLPVSNFNYSVINFNVTFTNTSVNATSYDWDFGDGFHSSEANPIHEYVDVGNYVVVLTATNPCGISTKSMLVITAPVANFVASPTTGCSALVVTMENQSSYNATNFLWTFPGGTPSSSSQANPTVIYSIAGTYSITLKATNTSGSHTFTQTNYITVKAIPTANFTTAINGSTVTCTNKTIGNADSFLWSFGDGNTSSLSNPVHTYAASGTYSLVLTATNMCGSSTKTQSLTLVSTVPPIASFTVNPLDGCVPLSVNFTNNSTGAISYSWVFPGGNPATSTAINPAVVYDTAGIYTVTLTATNINGSSTATSNITVNTVPKPGFTYAVSNDTTVSFANTSTGATSYLWTFGDGDSSLVANPVHNYPALDTILNYTVIMQAINDCGMVRDTQMVEVITNPKANFTAISTTGCAPLTVKFNNTSTPNANIFFWRFPGGIPDTSIVKNPVVIFSTPGTYMVSLIAGNASGSDTLILTNDIHVQTTPTVGFASSANGLNVTFSNASMGATSYTWDFGDGDTSTVANPSHIYAMDGTYPVMLSATNACGTITNMQSVTVTIRPTAGFTSSITSGCAPFMVQFTNTSGSNATSFDWQFPGGNPSSSTLQNPVEVEYTVPGTYTVTLTAYNAAGSSSVTQTGMITVNGAPATGFFFNAIGSTVNFINTSSNATTYNWNFGDGSNGTAENPSHTYLNDGAYTVTLLASNNCGATVLEQTILVSTPPTAAFATTDFTGCAPFSVQFTNQSSSNANSFLWDFPGGNPPGSSDVNPLVVWNTAGDYAVSLTAFNPAGSSSSTNTITVNSAPISGFTFQIIGLNAVFNNTTVNGTTYSWIFGDGGSSTEQNPTHLYANPGIYKVFLIVANDCGTTVIEQTLIIISSGTGEEGWIEGFGLFPNPNTGSFTVEMNGLPQEEVAFLLFNLLGQQIWRETMDFRTGSLLHIFDYGNLPAGIYTLRIQAAGQAMFVKIKVNR